MCVLTFLSDERLSSALGEGLRSFLFGDEHLSSRRHSSGCRGDDSRRSGLLEREYTRRKIGGEITRDLEISSDLKGERRLSRLLHGGDLVRLSSVLFRLSTFLSGERPSSALRGDSLPLSFLFGEDHLSSRRRSSDCRGDDSRRSRLLERERGRVEEGGEITRSLGEGLRSSLFFGDVCLSAVLCSSSWK